MTFKDITHVDDLNESKNMIDDLNAGKISYFTQEKRYIKKDKSVIVGKVIVSIMRDQEGSPSFISLNLKILLIVNKWTKPLKNLKKNL